MGAVSFLPFKCNPYMKFTFLTANNNYMKLACIIFIVLFTGYSSFSQVPATEGSVEFQKTQQPAAIIELPYPENVVEKGIASYMERKGSKGSDSKGFKTFRGYKLRDSQDFSSDLYFKIDRKSRKEKDITTVSLVVGRSGEDIKTRTVPDNSMLDGARDLLNDMVPDIEAYNLEVEIQDQDDVLKKAQKKFDGLVDDQKDYEKKIKNYQDKLEQNKRDQAKQDEEVRRQRDLMETLRAKRKPAATSGS